MTRLRPNEFFRKFLSKNRFEFQVQKWEIRANWRRRENSRQDPHVDRHVDRGLWVSTTLSTALSTRGGRAVLPGAPFLIWAWLCGLVLENSEI